MQYFRLSSQISEKLSHFFPFLSRLQLRVATILLFGLMGFMSAIALGWLLEIPIISDFFRELHLRQITPPSWLEVPQFNNPFWLYFPSLIFVSLVIIITKISPIPKRWSRTVVITILVGLTLRYFLWRSLSSLNLSNPVDGIFSLFVFLTEAMILGGMLVQSILNLNWKERHAEADIYSQAVISGDYLPSVDILIPTYDEPEFILKKTIIGCQALDYPHKEIYLLDDTRRPEIQQLAKTLDCHYITRPDNRHAKAGNLNHAITKTNGELITIFDADFVPTRNFLTRTVGFFQNPKIGIVQTCQGFYNDDAIAYNLGLEKYLNREDDFFNHYVQPIRDGAGCIICAGSSFVAKRQILEEVGGFNTKSLSEDNYTGLMVISSGYKVIYLNEKLSSGLSPENIPAYLQQKARWCQGTLQTLLFMESNVLNCPNLNFIQRIANLNSLLYWIGMIPQTVIMMIPLFYTFFGVRPIVLSLEEILYIFLPYYLINLISFYWLNFRCRTTLMSEIYHYIKIFPMVITIIKTFINPFGKRFKITPKGLLQKNGYFYWQLAVPIILLWSINAMSLGKSLINFGLLDEGLINLGLIWSIYNLIILSVVLIALRERPRFSYTQWFNLKQKIQFNHQLWLTTEKISEEGTVILTKNLEGIKNCEIGQVVDLEFPEYQLTLKAKIRQIKILSSQARITLSFVCITLSQYRKLVEILFCSPNRWQHETTPGELKMLWLFLKVLSNRAFGQIGS